MNNLKYEQPNIESDTKEYERLLVELNSAKSAEEQLKIIEEINAIRDNFFSMYWLSYINYLLDVNSDFWNEQENFFAKNDPIMNNLKLKYYAVLNNSEFKDELKSVIGDKVFRIAKLEVSLLSDEIIEDRIKEKELRNAYSKIIGSAKIKFREEELTLKQLSKYLSSLDREERIEASQKATEFFESVEEEIDNILDRLIKIRNNMARNLGFKSYTDMSYVEMRRLDYGRSEIESFRNQIVKYVVPFVGKLKELQKESLGLDKLKYYDEGVLFKDGNQTPKGDTKWIVEQASKMYKEISPKLHYLFRKMVDENLMDLDSRQGKSSIGITTYIPNHKVPIFISSFNGTAGNIATLTHEFGHSFQLYSSKDLKYYENWWPTFDTCEIHGESMNLLTLPYAKLFFDEDHQKYTYANLLGTLSNLCYISLIDEFQHAIYDEENLSIEGRKTRFRELEKKYMPWVDFEANDYLEKGNGWQKIDHIFSTPFYFIDHALGKAVALQFYAQVIENPNETWNKYIDFCALGGRYSFVESIESIGFKNPFEKDLIKDLVQKVEKETTKI